MKTGPEKPKNIEFKGLAISSGKVVSQVCVYSSSRHNAVAIRPVNSEKEVRREIGRFNEIRDACSYELDSIAGNVAKEVGKTESEIFITQKHIMNDPAIVDEITNKIRRERINVEVAIADVYTKYEEKFANLDNEYFSDRSTDIGEIRRRMLDRLSNTRPGFTCEGQEHCTRGKERVIVAEELTADMTVHMNLNHVRGIVTEHGGYSSHAAIIARSVGVPAVSGVKGIYQQVNCGDRILLDGDAGTVIIDPDEKTIRELIPIDYVVSDEVCMLSSPPGMMAFANASMLADVQQAMDVRADGIGLFRTEISFIRAERLISEDEQYSMYAEILRLVEGRPVTFRLLDIGGDKELPFLKITKESNPFLGLRGARFLLESNEIFSSQVKALVRLSKLGKVRILFPMVIDAVQLDKLLQAVREIIATVEVVPENLAFGAMFEVPSACLQAESVMKKVDFASIGSNDLIQYLFAVDRNNESVSEDYNPEHPALWDVLALLSNSAKKLDKPLSICGEMAGREGMASRLLDIGITALSVSPRLIPRVRNEMAEYVKNSSQRSVLSA